MRLQKYLAHAGVASRRKSERLIEEGRVKINGEIVRSLGTKIERNTDIIEVDGRIVEIEENKIYIKMNKPSEVITSAKDQFNRKTVLDLLSIEERVYPIGRLDYHSRGLLLLTNDGEFANLLMHPKYHVPKTYRVLIAGIPPEGKIEAFENGLMIEGVKTQKAKMVIKNADQKLNQTLVEITLFEGRNRQIRKMCDRIDHPVIDLKRITIGTIKLGNLKEGEWSHLRKDEINSIVNLLNNGPTGHSNIGGV